MSDLEMTADHMSAMSEALMTAIERARGSDNIYIIMTALGSVVGCIAQASGRPGECLELMTRTAQGVISGELLD